MSLVCLLAGAGTLVAAEGESTVVVNGIAHFGDRSLALLEITGPAPRKTVTRPILAAGERAGQVEVTLIDVGNGFVRVSDGGVETTFNLGDGAATPKRTFQFNDVPFGQVLEILQLLTDSTVLAPFNLSGARFTLHTGALSQAEALSALEAALGSKGVQTQKRGDKYTFVLPSSWSAGFPEMRELPAAAPGEEMFPAGMIKFVAADWSQALEIHQELTGRTLLRTDSLPAVKITVRTQQPASRSETIWMMEALFALNGIKLVPEGDKFLFALKAGPKVQAPVVPAEAAVMPAKDGPDLAPGTLKWMNADARVMLETFAALVGRKVSPSELSAPVARVTLRAQQSLTPSEAVYAMNALAALNELKFAPEGDQYVKLIPAAAGRQARLVAP